MRPDLAAWLDLFIPFDYSPHPPIGGPGEAMDWRVDSHRPNRYRSRGNRVEVQTAELNSITYTMTEEDVEHAFTNEALIGGAGVLAYAGHDRRNLLTDLERAHTLITRVAAGRPWHWANAQTALRRGYTPIVWNIRYFGGPATFFHADQTIYGCPFLAVADGNLVYRDNPTREDELTWAFKVPKGAHVAIAAWPSL